MYKQIKMKYLHVFLRIDIIMQYNVISQNVRTEPLW